MMTESENRSHVRRCWRRSALGAVMVSAPSVAGWVQDHGRMSILDGAAIAISLVGAALVMHAVFLLKQV